MRGGLEASNLVPPTPPGVCVCVCVYEKFATCNSNPLLISNALRHNSLHLCFEATKHMFVCSFISLVTETITNLLITCLWSESKPFRKERRAEKERERENQETSERKHNISARTDITEGKGRRV